MDFKSSVAEASTFVPMKCYVLKIMAGIYDPLGLYSHWYFKRFVCPVLDGMTYFMTSYRKNLLMSLRI